MHVEDEKYFNLLLVLSCIIYSAFYYFPYRKKFLKCKPKNFSCFKICFSLGLPEDCHCAEYGKILTSYFLPFQCQFTKCRNFKQAGDIPTPK